MLVRKEWVVAVNAFEQLMIHVQCNYVTERQIITLLAGWYCELRSWTDDAWSVQKKWMIAVNGFNCLWYMNVEKEMILKKKYIDFLLIYLWLKLKGSCVSEFLLYIEQLFPSSLQPISKVSEGEKIPLLVIFQKVTVFL